MPRVKTIKQSHNLPFVNITNIRLSFERYAKKAFVILDPLNTVPMNMKQGGVVTRSGKRAGAISLVLKVSAKRSVNNLSANRNIGINNEINTVAPNGTKVVHFPKDTFAKKGLESELTKDSEYGKKPSTTEHTDSKCIKDRNISNDKAAACKNIRYRVQETKNIENNSAYKQRLRNRDVKYYRETELNETNKKDELAVKVPVYRQKLFEKRIDKNKRDIYKFTDELHERKIVNSDNCYDKDIRDIMHLIHKAEREKPKRKTRITNPNSKIGANTKIKAKSIQKEFPISDQDLEKSRNEPRETSEVRSKNNLGLIPKTNIQLTKVQNLETNMKANMKKKTRIVNVMDVQIISDKTLEKKGNEQMETVVDEVRNKKIGKVLLKTVLQPSDVHVPNFADIAELEVNSSRATSPCNNNNNSWVSPQKDITCNNIKEDIDYNCSNNFGFNFDNPPLNTAVINTLLNLNEVSRKLQKRTPWRTGLVLKSRRFLTVKGSSLPNVDQEMILNSKIVDRLSSAKNTNVSDSQTILDSLNIDEKTKTTQKRLDEYFETNTNSISKLTHTNDAELSLFDVNDLSPIKYMQEPSNRSPTNKSTTNLISTPLMAAKRSILKTSNVLNLQNNISINNNDVTEDLENSYFGFIETNSKNKTRNLNSIDFQISDQASEKVSTSKENALKQTSPSKMPSRVDMTDINRFRRQYKSKKQRNNELRNVAVEMVAATSSVIVDSLDDSCSTTDAHDLPKLGLFDEIVEDQPRDGAPIRKRGRRLTAHDDIVSPTEAGKNKKRQKKTETIEFNKWVQKYNKLHDEIDKHELYVEKVCKK